MALTEELTPEEHRILRQAQHHYQRTAAVLIAAAPVTIADAASQYGYPTAQALRDVPKNERHAILRAHADLCLVWAEHLMNALEEAEPEVALPSR